ncbi:MULTISPECIES: flagellar export protein FliJ [Labrys]|jgi:flagellar export protein FliJ|uniref:flagellar export protein FliJ n=1 Tax=Labrys TaxID=204476 RepID=UPI00083274AE|nr:MULTISPECIES: flagellar export protein FliJ [unclassified Labrys (in: a-proteobacteria)]MDZ5449704.1 flagellar export protein FliJ [Labrys sp. ZIDIC5]OCC04932.1 flagellar export protein FliJ [Labrys sp. WJW]
MKSRDTLIRLKRFQADERRRQVIQIETMVAEFERMASELEREIKAEEAKAGITDPSHFAYPTYARAATARRDNLRGSADDLKIKLEDARSALTDALDDLKMVETLDDREKASERSIAAQ